MQCWTYALYLGHECVEVIGIPKSIESKGLEHTGCKICCNIDFNIGENRIEAHHRPNIL